MITINPVATVAEFTDDAPIGDVAGTYTKPVRIAPYMRRHTGIKRGRDEASDESDAVIDIRHGLRGVTQAVNLALAAFDAGTPTPSDLVIIYHGALLCPPDTARRAGRILDERGIERPSLAQLIGHLFIDDYGATCVEIDEAWEAECEPCL